jgi:hypothetical protein
MKSVNDLYKYLQITDRFAGSHDVHTPQALVEEILGKIDLTDKKIFVPFNVEFVVSLVCTFNVKPANILFYSDHKNKSKFVERMGVEYTSLLEQTMQFDVIVGNPPFKNGNETGGKSSLWRKIVAKSWSIVKDNGTLIMVSPQFPNSANDLGHIFTKNQTNIVWTKISHHFPGVGSSFFAWSVTKTPKVTDTLFINDGIKIDVTDSVLPNDLRSISILKKVLANVKFVCKSSPEYLHTSVADGKDDEHLYSKPTKKHTYIIRRTSGVNYQMYGAVRPTDYDLPKVVMTFSGNPHYKFHDKNDPIGTIKFQSGHILDKNKKEGENLIKLYQSKLYCYIQNQMSSGGMRGKIFYELPELDLTRTWTDQELFNYFTLTEDEINLVTGIV